MKIERLINIFEKLLPIYEKAYSEKWDYEKIRLNDLEWGICSAIYYNGIINNYLEISNVFQGGYYNDLLDTDYFLYPKPKKWQDLKPRIDFMKSEIKDLKRLLKKGYTHV